MSLSLVILFAVSSVNATTVDVLILKIFEISAFTKCFILRANAIVFIETFGKQSTSTERNFRYSVVLILAEAKKKLIKEIVAYIKLLAIDRFE
jgi:hypothetical protein